jgi:hypothetical protein
LLQGESATLPLALNDLQKLAMAAATPFPLGAFIQHESPIDATLKSPRKAIIHDRINPPTNIELDAIQWGKLLSGPSESGPGYSVPPTPGELERSGPPTPKQHDAVDALAASSPNTPRNRWRLASAGIVFFMVGMVDAVVSKTRIPK